ncbi:MAG TPA: gamma-glutamyl-gamma-aminobutyrate hydrolase family protein [Candidatus Tectomicrobia bacterium]|nr:gamma-glutamyl-gamma-aminobutyrate hydrolase family protein [Candidatus Tectomicrobia bacterium]
MIGITCDLDLGNGRESRAPGRKVHVLYDDYVHAVLASGGLPVLLPAVESDECREAYVQSLDGLLIPGSPADVDPWRYGEEPHGRLGPVNPLRTDFEIHLVRLALRRELPVFGICGGSQVLNVALGGSLYQDIPSQVAKAYKHSASPEPSHSIDIVPGTRLGAILGTQEMRVNSLHHQAVKGPGQGLMISASARDGIIEAVEMHSQAFVIGVQWHPERLFAEDEGAQRLFSAFVQQAAARRG